MRYSELVAVSEYLKKYDFIYKAKRVDDNTLLVRFDKEYEIGFVMTRGESTLYKKPQTPFLNNYNAPFDHILESLVSGSKILDIWLVGSDRVLRFALESKNSYKTQKFFLQFEFTGKFTNIIILDENETIIEALRHIDSTKSFRVVRPNIKLSPLPQKEQKNDTQTYDIETILKSNFYTLKKQKLTLQKNNLLTALQKKRAILAKKLNQLPSEAMLEDEFEQNSLYGNIILANLHLIKPYDKQLKTYDFEGNTITIKLPENVTKNRVGDYYFTLAKKAKNRAAKGYIQRENLTQKMEFLETSIEIVQKADEIEQLTYFLPQKSLQKKAKTDDDGLNVLWVDGHKVYVGRNQSENKKLLGISKANDVWMHLQNIASAHLIIKTDRQNVPQSVLQKCAILCIEFSKMGAGDYLVDYTKRKFVKPQEGANVFYTNYETIKARKDGIEIRS